MLSSSFHPEHCPYPDKRGTYRAYSVFFLCLFCSSALILRLWVLAMYDSTATEVLSGQYTRRATVTTHSGFVYDRKGQLLSHTQSGAVAIVHPGGIFDKNAVLEYLEPCLALSEDAFLTKLTGNEPFTVTLHTLPTEKPPRGVYIYPRYQENTGSFCRHLLGYHDIDGCGRDGLYKKYTSLLARTGTLSYRYQADAANVPLADDAFSVLDSEYSDSYGLLTTIDKPLQEALETVCDECLDCGAALICSLDGAAGLSLRALVSRPVYKADAIADSLNSDRGELVNRAFSLYTPGSVFKTVIACAALEKDRDYFDFSCECTGSITVGGKVFHCHKRAGHGILTMEGAYAHSCNVYFIRLAQELGLDTLVDMAQKLGLGECRSLGGLYVPGARLPDRAMRESPAYLANVSIGQGDVLVTPVDLAALYATAVTGMKRDVRVVRGIYDKGETVAFADSLKRRVLSKETVARLRRMMCACVAQGTGRAAQVAGISIGGKTATAQSGQYKNGEEVIHRIFAGVYPMEEPKYIVIILCDGNGDNTALPAKLFSRLLQVCGE